MYRDIRPAVSRSDQQQQQQQQQQSLLQHQQQEDDERAAIAAAAAAARQKKAITSVACTSCRQRRIKCDGAKPACGACRAKGKDDCEYDVDRASRRIGVLRARIRNLESEVDYWRNTSTDGSGAPSRSRDGGPDDRFERDETESSGITPNYDGDDTIMSDSGGTSAPFLNSRDLSASESPLRLRLPSSVTTSDSARSRSVPGLPVPSDILGSRRSSRPGTRFHREAIAAILPVGEKAQSFLVPTTGEELQLYGDMSLIKSLAVAGGSPAPTRQAEQMFIPIYLVQPLNFTDHEVLSRLYSSFLKHSRTLAVQGFPAVDNYGDPMNVALLLPGYHKDQDMNVDPVTAFIAGFLATFGLRKLPEQLGIMHLLYRLIQWQISPTQETHSRIPPSMRPSPLQRLCPHPAWIEFLVWPDLRDAFVAFPELRRNDGGSCMPILMETMNVHWTNAPLATVFQDRATGFWHITPAFQKHCEDHQNWSVGSVLLNHFPGLTGKIWIDDGPFQVDGQEGRGPGSARHVGGKGVPLDGHAGVDGVDGVDGFDGVGGVDGVGRVDGVDGSTDGDSDVQA